MARSPDCSPLGHTTWRPGGRLAPRALEGPGPSVWLGRLGRPRPTAEHSKLTTPGNTLATSPPTAAACRGAPGGGWGGLAPARERWPSPRASPQTPHQVLCPPRGHCRVAEPSEAWSRAALQGGPERPAVRDCHGRHYCPQQRTWGRARPSTGGHGGLRSAWRPVGALRLGGRVLGSLLPRAGAASSPWTCADQGNAAQVPPCRPHSRLGLREPRAVPSLQREA